MTNCNKPKNSHLNECYWRPGGAERYQRDLQRDSHRGWSGYGGHRPHGRFQHPHGGVGIDEDGIDFRLRIPGLGGIEGRIPTDRDRRYYEPVPGYRTGNVLPTSAVEAMAASYGGIDVTELGQILPAYKENGTPWVDNGRLHEMIRDAADGYLSSVAGKPLVGDRRDHQDAYNMLVGEAQRRGMTR